MNSGCIGEYQGMGSVFIRGALGDVSSEAVKEEEGRKEEEGNC